MAQAAKKIEMERPQNEQEEPHRLVEGARLAIVREVTSPVDPKRSDIVDCAKCVGECKTF